MTAGRTPGCLGIASPARLYLKFIGILLRQMAARGKALPAHRPTFQYDIETHEYAAPEQAIPATWELTRGLGKSFGYNAQETAADTLSGTALVHLLADVVSKGGNLLVNVGPDGEGRILEIQKRPLRELGAWLQTNGEAIFETRAWKRPVGRTAGGQPVRFTQRDGLVYVLVLDHRLDRRVIVRDVTVSARARVRLLGSARELEWTQTSRRSCHRGAAKSGGVACACVRRSRQRVIPVVRLRQTVPSATLALGVDSARRLILRRGGVTRDCRGVRIVRSTADPHREQTQQHDHHQAQSGEAQLLRWRMPRRQRPACARSARH